MIGTVRMVTLDGDLVEKSGAMTGGFRNKSKLKFKASEEEKIRALAEQITVGESERDRPWLVDTIDVRLRAEIMGWGPQVLKLSAHGDELKADDRGAPYAKRHRSALRDERRLSGQRGRAGRHRWADVEIVSLSSETAYWRKS
jgi:chromosome segregation protein